jgi:hypothetical protein
MVEETASQVTAPRGRKEVITVDWEATLNIIRGKNLVGKASKDDVLKVFAYIDLLEMKLDEADFDDTFGTEGWRHYFGIADD